MDLLNWESNSTDILINPKIPEDQRTRLWQLLSDCGLEGHIWLSTSGSSSTSNISPKWVALSKQAVLTSAESVNKHLCATKNDRWIHALPHFHVGGLGIAARAYLSNAQVVVCDIKWDPPTFHQWCHDQKGTLTALVPTQLYDLVQQDLKAPPSLRATIIGGGGLSEDLYQMGRSLGWNPLPSYGFSECASQVATACLESLESEEYPELQFLSHIDEVNTTEDGCFKLYSPALLTSYAIINEHGCSLQDPKVDGWFETEDLVTIHGRGLTIHGRKTDIVKVGGENVNIELLNRLLSDLSAGNEGDQAIVAVPCERLGNEVHLAEANTAPQQLNKLINSFNERVLPFERIKSVHHLKKIPRTTLNKLKKDALLAIIRDTPRPLS